jgi:hypothetical protein
MRMTRELADGMQLEDIIMDGRCGARNRQGKPCLCSPATGTNGRCRFHGGLSTGPKTPETKARSIAAMKEGHRRWLEAGRPRREARSKVTTLNARMRASRRLRAEFECLMGR